MEKYHKCLNKNGYILCKHLLGDHEMLQIKKDLTIMPYMIPAFKQLYINTNNKEKQFNIYVENANYIYVPRFYGIKKYGAIKKSLIKEGNDVNVKMLYSPLEHQKIALEKTLNTLKNEGGGVLSLPCGYGKTFIAVLVSTVISKKTLIVVNKETLLDQWIEAILQFTDTKIEEIGIVRGNNTDTANYKYIISMLQSCSMKDYDKNIFSDIGFTIIDECHHIGSEIFSKALPIISSNCMLGLSATPERSDKMSNVFYYYIGKLFHSEKRTGNDIVHVKTLNINSKSDEYKDIYMFNGMKHTVNMISALSNSERRNNMIIDIIKSLLYNGDRQILLLSGRREQLKSISNLLEVNKIKNKLEKYITWGYYYGSNGSNKSKHKAMLLNSSKCDIILGTYEIASEGLDIPTINTEILATPCNNIEQAVGRMLRKKHTIPPILVDIVDELGNFVKHYGIRKTFYNEENYIIDGIDVNIDNYDNNVIDKYIKNIKSIKHSISNNTTHISNSAENISHKKTVKKHFENNDNIPRNVCIL